MKVSTKLLRRVRNVGILFIAMNVVMFVWEPMWQWGVLDRFAGRLLVTGCIFIAFAVLEIIPCYENGLSFRLQVLAGGYELIVSAFWALLAEVIFYIWILGPGKKIALLQYVQDLQYVTVDKAQIVLITNAIVAVVVMVLHFLNGFWRTVFTCSQLGVVMRAIMLLFWWMPIGNIMIFWSWCKRVRREIIFERDRYLLDKERVENAVCKTKYPVVMVHGIFFRDWQFFNYWGRIPKELKRNGANVYYGHQQSSLSIADSAEELKREILDILEQSGAPKVNIVAHSKGGLDSRYAISKLGLEDKVASLTTINTPHRGCRFAENLLNSLPKGMIRFVDKKYNSLFRKLGDEKPDFLAGVRDLTASSCAAFNEEVKDSPLVYYQSSASQMAFIGSAGFPLNLGYMLAKKCEGPNDGLVSVSSAQWGHFLGVLKTKHYGISHGDMIDLTRRNIKDFNICEFYVKILEDLKARGL